MWEAKETKIKRHVKRWINQMFRRYTGAAPVEQISMIEKQFNDLIRLVEIDTIISLCVFRVLFIIFLF